MRFIEYLVQQDYLNKANQKVVQALASNTEVHNAEAERLLDEAGAKEAEVLEYKKDFFNLPGELLEGELPTYDVLKSVPEESVTYYMFAPLRKKDGVLEVGMVDPEDMEARDALQFISSKLGLPLKIFVITAKTFARIAEGYKGITGEVSQALSQFETAKAEQHVETGDIWNTDIEDISRAQPGGETTIIQDAPVSKIVAVILRHAIEGKASDVHIEHINKKVRVRFRVDGELFTSLFLPTNVHSAVVSRIKILAHLKIDEKRKPQDGRFSARVDERKIDFRVSTMPSYYGEKVVMRILDSGKAIRALAEIGMREDSIDTIHEAIKRPYGMILITGPTGSGKSTTLYSMLNEVDREKKNVVSLEDPIEYSIEGLNQSQVRPEIGYTFANGLRSILRQDPDVIMVGEIRDKETAQLAVQAALTGHLVLSTLHTNNSIGVVPRLIDMGIDPYLIAPTLILAIAQRLARKLCAGAGEPIPVEGSIRKYIDGQFQGLDPKYREKIQIPNDVYKARPTAECPVGTRGRVAVMETLLIDKKVEHAILNNPIEPEIWDAARSSGMLTIKEDALIKAFKGEISFEEATMV